MRSRSGTRSVTTVSSRELDQNIRRAKRATKRGPVFITARGKPSHVLLSFEDYQQLVGEPNIVDLLAIPTSRDLVLELQRAKKLYRGNGLS